MNSLLKKMINELDSLEINQKISAINNIKLELHKISPFQQEPVDCVVWIKNEDVIANDYNPNAVAPPEMKLLEHSIIEDGYTQPIVTWKHDEINEVVDGFHRHRVGKESKKVSKRINGYLPVVVINDDRTDRGDRIAATIRHNRARGKHKVEAMSDIVVELKRRNWSDEKIAKNLGMDADEVLRLTQITGLAELFKDKEFSKAWEVDNKAGIEISEDIFSNIFIDKKETDASDRIYHTYDKWECYKHGFYEEKPPNGMTIEEGEQKYKEFLSDLGKFEKSLKVIISEWKYSCEHYLSNEKMNRIAWLGQAAMAHALKIPACCRSGYNLLTDGQKKEADLLALKYLNKWLISNNRKKLTVEEAGSKTEANLY